MAEIQSARMTHEHEGPIGVFLIGMRLNQLRRPHQWLPVLLAMPKMLTELYRNRAATAAGEATDLGFLGARTLVGGKGVTVVQYWRSVEDIYRYASAPDHEHRHAWTAFNARARKARGVVGILLEPIAVPAGSPDSVYHGMPILGLFAATASATVPSRKRYAGLRCVADETPASVA
jgi:heme-degrading monooxygenase HmoA